MGHNKDQMKNKYFLEAAQSVLDDSVRDIVWEKFKNGKENSLIGIIVQDPTKFNLDFIMQCKNRSDTASHSDDSSDDSGDKQWNNSDDNSNFYDIANDNENNEISHNLEDSSH